MTALVGILSSLVLSPLLFCASIAVGGILLLTGRRRAGGAVLGAALAVLLVLSTGAGSRLLLAPLERTAAPGDAALATADVVVVLGGGLKGGEVGPESLERLVAGAVVARERSLPVIVSGGETWASGGEGPEAAVAARTLEALGLPRAQVIPEAQSATTWENARRSAAVMAARGYRRAVLVTSAWHIPRAILSFERAGVDIVPLPVAPVTAERLDVTSFLPAFGALADSFAALHEYLGIAAYRLRR